MPSISAIVLAKNEVKNIRDCLLSLKWCDEIIVIDDGSHDKTVSIAKGLGAKVIHHPMDDFARQRNFGLKQAKGAWVLFIDADERVSDALKQEILCKISYKNNLVVGYFIKRQDNLWGKKLQHGEVGNMKLLRLAQKDVGVWEGSVHEEWIVKGQVENISNPLLHYPHQTVRDFLREINFYSDIRALELYKQNTKVNAFSVIMYPKSKFIVNYFVKLGFLDGVHGLVHASMMSLHSFLVRGKLWLLWQKS